jgi:type IV secretory pathway VirD2 relaxase
VTALSFERLLKSSRLATPLPKRDAFVPDRTIRLTRPDREKFEGKVSKSGGGSGGGSNGMGLASKLSQRVKKKPRSLKLGSAKPAGVFAFDQRQRAVVKIHYFNHAGTGAASLKAHAKYIARDGAGRDGLPAADAMKDAPKEDRDNARAHATYLDRRQRIVFYDAHGGGVDGATRMESWAHSDRRHFRLILSAEEGASLRDLQAYTREVMARAGAALGTTLNWVAVDHHDTDNPHSHIVLRGRRANGQDLVLPRDFIKHGFRSIARDVATEWLGTRTPEQERLALEREARRHGPTRLDAMVDGQARANVVKIASLEAPNADPALSQAMKARVRELARMGLAEESGRGLFRLTPDWRGQLKSMELHLDIRKRLMHERSEQRLQQHRDVTRGLGKGLLDR